MIYLLQRLESTDSARISSDYTLRKRLVDGCFAEIQNKYLVLCNKNQSIAAMYEYVEFLEEGERYGVNPDYEAALKYLNKAANLGHSYAHLDLSDIHGGDYWCSYPNVENDLAISFEHLVSASLCSAWDGHKGIEGPSVAPEVAHYALFEALSSGLFYGAGGAVEVDTKKAIDHLIQGLEGGHKDAQFELYMHYHQLGEIQEANGWLRKAASPTSWFTWKSSGRSVL